MKIKILLAVIAASLCVPAFAEVGFHMKDGNIVLTGGNSCEIDHFVQAMKLVEDGDDDPAATEQAPFSNEEIKNKIGPNIPFISSAAFARVSAESITNADLPDEFDEIKLDMIKDIRLVNWKTGYNISARDLSVWDKISFVCGKVTSDIVVPAISTYTMPAEMLGVDVNKAATEATDKLTKSLQYAIMDSKLKQEIRYTPEGLYFAIITKNPFLLVTIDDDVYATLEKTEMKILKQYGKTKDDRLLGILFQNMHKFFDLRAKFLGFNGNLKDETKALYKMSRQGAGDAWSTYKLLADHAIQMNSLLNQHVLTEDYEKNTFLSLRKLFIQIGNDVKKHHMQENAIRKDPANAEMVKRVEQYKHIQNVKENALKELKNTTEADKELLMRAYKKD